MTVPGIWAVEYVLIIACWRVWSLRNEADLNFSPHSRLGRRFLLLYGAAGMAFSQLIVAIVGVATPEGNQAAQKVLVAFVCIFIAHFAATWGPLAWVVTSEIYPTTTRGKQMSMSTASNWLLNFAIGYATPYLVDDVPGSAGLKTNVFWIERSCFTALLTIRTSELTSFFFVHSGEDVVSSVSFSPTSAFPKPRVSHSNKSISSTATRLSASPTLSANKSSTRTWVTKLETLTELPRTTVPSTTRRRPTLR